MDPQAILALISDLYSQAAAANRRIAELEAREAAQAEAHVPQE